MTTTVIIVNWNSKNMLDECLDCLTKQTVQAEHIFVVDNASTDDSVKNAAAWTNNVTLMRMHNNVGFAAANNFALSKCKTEFVALLNPDAFPEPYWLEALLTCARENPKVSAFGSRQLSCDDPKVLDGTGDNYHISGLAWRNRHGKRQQQKDLLERVIFSPCAAAALYRRQAIVEVGGFDEDFFCYVEDVDLGFRLRLAGHQARYVPDAVAHHVGTATTGGQWADFAVYHGFRNQVWTFIKNMPGFLFWLMLPLHLALNLASIFLFSIRGQAKVIFKAKKDALRGVPLMWKKRQDIQHKRIASSKDVWKVLDKRLFLRRPHLPKDSSHCTQLPSKLF